VEILVWVGLPITAGTQLWPLDGWAELRAAATGDRQGSDPRAVQRDLDRVLAAMHTRPQWHHNYVERPLEMKTPPLAPSSAARGAASEPVDLIVTAAEDAVDLCLVDLASLALAAIEAQLGDGGSDEAAIGRTITTVFGRIDTSGEFAQAGDPLGGRPIEALVDDPGRLERIADVVREILQAQVKAA
jgi:hypothetical protein